MLRKAFNQRIVRLLHVHPADKMDGDRPFWTLPRRLPKALTFDTNDATHMSYIVSLASLYAKLFGITLDATLDLETIRNVAATTESPEFILKGDTNHELDPSLTDEQRKKLQEDAVSLDGI